ncbi:MAG: FecR domain-containing protein [Balneolaceae bacterium]
MDHYNEKIWFLITRKLSGESTAEENDKLRQWVNKDPKNRKFYDRLESSWKQNPGESADSFFLSVQFNYENGLDKLRGKLNQESGLVIKNRIIGKKSSGSLAWKWVAVVLAVVMTSVFFLTTSQGWDEPGTTTYATSEVEQRIITLADGSVVRLNRNSTLEVSENRPDGSRTIRLDGEAFFDVTHNPDRTFVVHAGDAVVEVLGTSFNVKKGSQVMVAVQEGLVSLRHQNHEERSTARLTADQLGLLTDDGDDVKIEETNIENYMSWKNGYLNFNNMPFGQVLIQLERIYGTTHELQDSSISAQKLTVYTEKVQLKEVIEAIALAMELTYDMKETTIVWQQKEAVKG